MERVGLVAMIDTRAVPIPMFEHPAYTRYMSYKSSREHRRASVTDIRAYQREEQIKRYARGQPAHSRDINFDRER